ncbi:hypothetical protein [Streptococcus loxodontisalivarius]|uniref:Lipoprotein n=1 Tax=Streptococcus loxodontisalivarius TaxID=1349415 RepID=A0ABS2PTF9_9STRE|nr:hypothetical protein [Streptococcus loxodontisalivarius]MBM7643321.1 hypothetical protein [Streptococcus loxodontisalivarius]
MKKNFTRAAIFLMTSLLLVACSQKADTVNWSSSNSSSKSQTTSQSETRTTVSLTETTSTSQETEASSTSNEQLYAVTLQKVAEDTSEGHATQYAFYDIDHNGTAELITGVVTSGQNYISAIYYLNKGVSTYLSQSSVAPRGGNREVTQFYEDGRIAYYQWLSGSGQGTAYLYQLRADNTGYDIVQEISFDMSQGQKMPDFSQNRQLVSADSLNWHGFS